MDDQSSVGTVEPVLSQPPEQEFQTRNDQLRQDRTPDNPPFAGVSRGRALEGRSLPGSQEFVPTTATTIDEILRAAYFVAASIDAPVVEVVNPHVVNMHFPADGSLATVKVEARPGAWGGLQPKSSTPEQDAERNEHYDAMLAASQTAPPPEALSRQEAHDDAHAREEAKPQEPRQEEGNWPS